MFSHRSDNGLLQRFHVTIIRAPLKTCGMARLFYRGLAGLESRTTTSSPQKKTMTAFTFIMIASSFDFLHSPKIEMYDIALIK